MEKPTVFIIKAEFGRTWQDGYWLVKIAVIEEVSPLHISAGSCRSVASEAAVAQETSGLGREGKQPQTFFCHNIFQTDNGTQLN